MRLTVKQVNQMLAESGRWIEPAFCRIDLHWGKYWVKGTKDKNVENYHAYHTLSDLIKGEGLEISHE